MQTLSTVGPAAILSSNTCMSTAARSALLFRLHFLLAPSSLQACLQHATSWGQPDANGITAPGSSHRSCLNLHWNPLTCTFYVGIDIRSQTVLK